MDLSTAEKAAALWLEAWGTRNWERMLRSTQVTWAAKRGADGLKRMLGYKRLRRPRIVESNTVSAVMVDVTAEVEVRGFSGAWQTERLTLRVIRESAPYQPSEEGVWGVNPISALRVEKAA